MLRRECSGGSAQEGVLRRAAQEGVLRRGSTRGVAQEGVLRRRGRASRQAGKQASRQSLGRHSGMGGWFRFLGIWDAELNLELELVNRQFSVQNTNTNTIPGFGVGGGVGVGSCTQASKHFISMNT